MANYSNYSVKLNNSYNEEMVTFNHIPTILSITPTSTQGTKSEMTLTIKGGEFDSTVFYYIQINDTKIFATDDISKVANNVFLISRTNSQEINNGLAYYLCKALNNTKLSNSFDIYVDKQSRSIPIYNKVIIKAKENGAKEINFQTNFPNSNIISSTFTQGTSSDTLLGTKIVVDIYGESTRKNATEISGNEQILPFKCQLEKNYTKGGTHFDLAPLLGNYTDDGYPFQYNAMVSAIAKDGTLNILGYASRNFALNGYDMDVKYIPTSETYHYFLQNVEKGESKPTLNNTILYYVDKITYSILWYEFMQEPNKTVVYKYYNSAMTQIGSTTKTIVVGNSLTTETFQVPSNINAYYIDVEIEDIGTVRYTNIKPLKYGDSRDYETIYWHNSLGGTSFFPFTASITEEYDNETKTYKPSHFDLYENDDIAIERTYINDATKTITLKSHYMEKDGTYTLKDLYKAYTVWILDKNGNKVYISIDDLSIEEVQHNLYQATLSFKLKSI